MSDNSNEKEIRCAFCDRAKDHPRVSRFVAANATPDTYICDVCIELFNDLVKEEEKAGHAGIDIDVGIPIVPPEEVGLSPERLERINTAMQGYVDQDKLAGIITAVARSGKVAHFGCFGMMHKEAEKPMNPDTIFRIYSMTKPIASVAIMMLHEEGHFHLTDPVSKFIPEFKNLKVFVKQTDSGNEVTDLEREMEIWHLLTHTSGLTYGFDPNFPVDKMYQKAEILGSENLKEMIQKLGKLPLVCQPGSKWIYSVSTDVIGYLVEVISGQPFDVFLKERIFEPLGMKDTGFHVPEDKRDRFAANYSPVKDGSIKVFDDPATSRFAKPATRFSGGGGLVSTTADYMRFAQMMLNEGELDGVRLLGRKTVKLMTMNHLPENTYPFETQASGFGLGVSVVNDVALSRSARSKGSFGWGGAAGTRFWIDPAEEIIGILMIQIMPGEYYPIEREFNTLVYQAVVD